MQKIFLTLLLMATSLFSFNLNANPYYKTFSKAPIKCMFLEGGHQVKTETVSYDQQEYIHVTAYERNTTKNLYYKILSRDKGHTEGGYLEFVTAIRVYFSNSDRFQVSELSFSKSSYLQGYFPYTDVHGKAGSIKFLQDKYGASSFQKDLINCSQSFK